MATKPSLGRQANSTELCAAEINRTDAQTTCHSSSVPKGLTMLQNGGSTYEMTLMKGLNEIQDVG
jgi:hypothetical protein